MRRDDINLQPVDTAAKIGVLNRLRAFYAANPSEELTFLAISIKFSCTLWTARHAVYALVDAGELESVHVIRLREKGMAKEEETHS